MKTVMCLVRHGQTDWNKNLLIQGTIDNPLNDYGRETTKKSIETIKELNIEFDTFLSSPLSRAIETGEIIKRGLGFNGEIKIIPGLIERDLGLLEGKKVCKESYDLMKIGVEGLEMLPELQERALKTILDINRLFPSKKILITTHSQFIKGLLSKVLDDFDFSYPLKNNSLTLIEVENNKVNVIQYDIIK